jgi:hypothetical protein
VATAYQRLLTETDAHRVLLVEVTYHDGVQERVYRASRDGWMTKRYDSLADLEFSDTLISDLNVATDIDSGETLGGVAAPDDGLWEFDNTGGEFDEWRNYRVDGLPVRALMVGQLADGTNVTYSDASETPLLEGRGKGRPRVSRGAEGRMLIAFGGPLYQLRRVMNTKVFSPPCPEFPGTTAGCIDFGDNFDATGSFTWGFWIYSHNPGTTGQYIFQKDTGTAGYYCELGTAGNGALRFGIRGQTPLNTDTAAGLVRIGTDHFVAVHWDSASATRKIFLDGTEVASTTGIVGGSPGGNTASFKVGSGFRGRISKGAQWSIAQTATQVRADIFLPLLGTETNLTALPLMQEGKGGSTEDGKSGSVVTGTLGTGVSWTTSSWCGQSLVGKLWPLVLGKALRVPLTPLDPARGTFATCWPPPVAPPVLYSNHNPVLAGYTYDSTRGLVTLSGAATGQYSADLCGETPFRGAIAYDGSTGYASGTVPCPAGTVSISALIRPDTTETNLRCVAGWTAGGGAGQRLLAFSSTASNLLRFVVRNDAGTAYVAEYSTPLVQGRWVRVQAVLDVPGMALLLYINGAMVATAAVAGTFNTTATAFTISRNSTSAIQFLAGAVDDVSIWSRALGIPDAEDLTVHPDAVDSTGRTQYWRCDAGSGSTLVNSVGGGATLTLAGTYSWTQSRIAPADGVDALLTEYTDYDVADLNTSSIAAYLRQTVADCGAMVADESTCLDVADSWLRGVTSYVRPGIDSGLLEMGQVQLATGTPDEGADFGEGDIPEDATIEPADDRIAAPLYGVNFLHARNYSPQDAAQLAGILTTQPALYQFGQTQWRDGLAPDWSVVEDYPQAGVLTVESPLLNVADALAESARALPLYGEAREPYIFEFSTPGLRLQPGGEMRVTLEEPGYPPSPVLGMGAPGRSFRILSVVRNGEQVTTRGLA